MTMMFEPTGTDSYGEMKVRGKLKSQSQSNQMIVPILLFMAMLFFAWKGRTAIKSDLDTTFKQLFGGK